jgi:hypothetical protein
MLFRIRGDIIFRIVISFLAAALIVLVPDYQYLVYRTVKPLTTQEIEAKNVYKAIGYPAADDVFQAKSVEDIKHNFFFTITVDRSDITPTGYYEIIDSSKTGVNYGTGRYSYDTYTEMYLNDKLVAFVESKLGKEYGQFYVIKLKNGEKVIAYLDPTLLKGKGEIRLPIGKESSSYPKNYFASIRAEYGLEEENSAFFVQAADTTWLEDPRMIRLNVMKFFSFFAIVIVVLIFSTKLLKKYNFLQ